MNRLAFGVLAMVLTSGCADSASEVHTATGSPSATAVPKTQEGAAAKGVPQSKGVMETTQRPTDPYEPSASDPAPAGSAGADAAIAHQHHGNLGPRCHPLGLFLHRAGIGVDIKRHAHL